MLEMLALKHFAVAYLHFKLSSLDKTKIILFYSQRSRSTVSLETYPFIHLFIYLFNHIYCLPLYDTSITQKWKQTSLIHSFLSTFSIKVFTPKEAGAQFL